VLGARLTSKETGAPSQKPPRKRKRAADIDDLISAAFDKEPDDYKAAWNSLKSIVEKVAIPGRLPTVSLYS